MIQDIVFTLGGLVFLASLIPTLRNPRAAVPLGTSIPTGIILLAFSATQASLGLEMAAVTSVVTGMAWLAIAARRRLSHSQTEADWLRGILDRRDQEAEALRLALSMALADPRTGKITVRYGRP